MSDRIECLQALLDDLVSEAPVESSGTFTVDPLRALEKLARFQLQSPYEYVLKLVQSAVAADASEISIPTPANSCPRSPSGPSSAPTVLIATSPIWPSPSTAPWLWSPGNWR